MGGWSRLAGGLAVAGGLLADPPARAQDEGPPPPAARLGTPVPPPAPQDDLDVTPPPGLAPPPPLPKNWQPRPPKYQFGTQFGAALLATKNGLPGYGVTWYPSAPVRNQNTELSLSRQELSLFTPFWKDGPDTAIGFLGIKNSRFDTKAVLPDSGQEFPDGLWDVNAGVSYSHTFAEGWTAGVNVNAGSPSDKPFSQADVLTAGIVAFLTTPGAENDHWIFALLYSPTADTRYPIPGVAYFFQPNSFFEANIGIPFLLKWKPWDDVTFEAFYLPIRTASARLTWDTLPGVRSFAAFNWGSETYFLANRAEYQDRLFAFEKRVTAGVSFDLPLNLAVELSGGYAFDRIYFQGSEYADRYNDRVTVDNGWFVQLQLRLKF